MDKQVAEALDSVLNQTFQGSKSLLRTTPAPTRLRRSLLAMEAGLAWSDSAIGAKRPLSTQAFDRHADSELPGWPEPELSENALRVLEKRSGAADPVRLPKCGLCFEPQAEHPNHLVSQHPVAAEN